MRVSTAGQSFDLQRDAIAKAGCERVYDDTCSGRATERPGLARALEVARAGDALVVWKLDRIGRSLPYVVQFVGDLQKRGPRRTGPAPPYLGSPFRCYPDAGFDNGGALVACAPPLRG